MFEKNPDSSIELIPFYGSLFGFNKTKTKRGQSGPHKQIAYWSITEN